MSHLGKVCPYCKSHFEEEEDVVVCSACEMPHHKSCWMENKGCTTFGCTGTIEGLTEEAPAMQQEQPQDPNGANYQAYQQILQGNQTWQGDSNHTQSDVEDMKIFLQSNQEVYIPRFLKMRSRNTKVSWNWSGFLFSIFFTGSWMAFRKMYGLAFASVGIVFVTRIMVNLIMLPFLFGLSYLITIAFYACSGIFCNYFYMRQMEKHMAKVAEMPSGEKQKYLEECGGTNTGGAVGIAILGIMINSFFGQMMLSSYNYY